jgi:shikimate 5-dehydrogenase
MKKYAVIGNPVTHSLSPWIHQQFAQQSHLSIDYQAITLACQTPSALHAELVALCQKGYQGLNVTLPYKTWVFDLMKAQYALTERALSAGAVNTIAFASPTHWLGDNTDGVGLVTDLQRLGWQVAGQRILILGAGGAASGVLGALLSQAPQQIAILNRDRDKATQLAARFTAATCKIDCIDQPHSLGYDLIINATASSLSQQLPATITHLTPQNAHCYDMVYAPLPTVFLAWALANRAVAISDGLGMLVAQAAESFYLWHGIRPFTVPTLEQLQTKIANL